jgi:hypothetical protein
MEATNLSPEIWNAIADLIGRSQTAREIYTVKVTKVDKNKKLIWATDYGDVAIPLVSHDFSFSYFDTQLTANPTTTLPVRSKLVKKEDKTQENPVYRVEIVTPKVGDLVVILDPLGAKEEAT